MAKIINSKPGLRLTIVILAKNAQQTLTAALQSIPSSVPILVLDDHSTDATIDIALKHQARVLTYQGDFAAKRNRALKEVRTDWIFYLDADEVISPELAVKLEEIVDQNEPGAYSVQRVNYFLGTKMYPDRVERLFHRLVIKGWRGEVHESPVLTRPAAALTESLIHHTHRDIDSMLEKTNEWSEIEAKLRLAVNHPPVKWWRLVRIAATVFGQQLIGKKLLQFGRAGLFEAYFQMVDKLIVYVKLYERQLR